MWGPEATASPRLNVNPALSIIISILKGKHTSFRGIDNYRGIILFKLFD